MKRAVCLFIYCSVIRPLLEYACAVWHSSITQQQSQDIENIQKRVLRTLYGWKSYEVCYNNRDYLCNELGGNMARSTQFPIMITRSTIIYEIVSPGAAGSSIYI